MDGEICVDFGFVDSAIEAQMAYLPLSKSILKSARRWSFAVGLKFIGKNAAMTAFRTHTTTCSRMSVHTHSDVFSFNIVKHSKPCRTKL